MIHPKPMGLVYATAQLKGVITEDDLDRLIVPYKRVPSDAVVMDIAITSGNTIILTTDGCLYSFGIKGEVLGRAHESAEDASRIGKIIFQNRIVLVVTGTHHVLALDMNGLVYSWGENEYGQLGHDDSVKQKVPKEIEIFKKDPVVQIYAGGDSSYALTRNGDLYVWGDNRCFQLGILGTYHQEPKLLIHTPWEKSTNKEHKMVYGKNLLGINFKIEVQGKAIEQKSNGADQSGRIKELNDKLAKMLGEITDLRYQAYGQNPQMQQMQQKTLNEDRLLQDIKQQEGIVKEEMKDKTQQILLSKDDIEQVKKDLDGIKQQLVDISEKENQLIGERDRLDHDLRHAIRNKEIEKQERIGKEQKRIRDQMLANDNIKNTQVKRQSESELVRLKKQDQLTTTENQLKALQQRLKLFERLKVERVKTIKRAYIYENKLDLEKFMLRVYYAYKLMQETNITEISKKSQSILSLSEMIKQSNAKLRQIRQELGAFKVNPTDSYYDILSRILEILQDNISTRLRLNDYLGGILLQVSQKNEEYVEDFHQKYQSEAEQKAEHKLKELKRHQQAHIMEYIMKQKQKQTERGREYIEIKGYTKDVIVESGLKGKPTAVDTQKNRGCIG